LLNIFSRFVCAIVGHVPLPKTDSLATSEDQTSNADPNLYATARTPSIRTLQAGSGYNLGSVVSTSSLMTVNSPPFELQLKICCRCNTVYWQLKVKQWDLIHINNAPDLKEATELKKRALWEKEQRKKNDLANKLYKQYLMVLKLGHEDEG
jgi:hypothetical protein